ncbi:mersacidin/lichenicidin family type 2 lantibiotic [Plantactinospora sp. CA-290183]|uniref:mersacidin/lichenicidin family type 2 lantibiotic n=1 Tax=Plantactinospora sp. CA-290183 TaxID=3240006 RepID=UPI003D8AF2CC
MDIIKAWRDPVYRASLTDEQRAGLPAHPAGAIELTDADLDVTGGAAGTASTSLPCGITWAAGCFTLNSTFCNGTCAANTAGCCG